MDDPGIVSLGDIVITTAGTYVGDVVAGLEGLLAAAAQLRFAYGSGGTTVRAYLQTSLDQGVTWIDIAAALFDVPGSKSVLQNFSALTPKTTQVIPTDGTLTDNTAVDGLLGDRFRLKVVSTGTYAGNTLLSGRMNVR